jgi:hypothetical protein
VLAGANEGKLSFLPLYLPFLLTFAIKAHEWRGLKWSLRVGSALALLIRLSALGRQPDFGNDVAGNIRGTSYNFAWIWGSGAACAVAAVLVGFLLRVVLSTRPRESSEKGPVHPGGYEPIQGNTNTKIASRKTLLAHKARLESITETDGSIESEVENMGTPVQFTGADMASN